MISTLDFDFLAEHGQTVVNQVNHREFLYKGRHYIFGWNSKLNPKTGEVFGWMLLEEADRSP